MCSVISSSRKVHHSTPHHTTTQHITHNLSSLSDQWVEVVYEVSWIRQEDSQIMIILAGEVRREVLAQGVKAKDNNTRKWQPVDDKCADPKNYSLSPSLSLSLLLVFTFLSQSYFALVYYVISMTKK